MMRDRCWGCRKVEEVNMPMNGLEYNKEYNYIAHTAETNGSNKELVDKKN